MKLVINRCYGGFGLSTAAYEKLIEWGVPVRKYIEQDRDEQTGLYKPQPLNDGEVIFDRELTPPGEDSFSDLYWKYKDSGFKSRYWDGWTCETRNHPLVVRVVEELGKEADGPHAELSVVEIPDGIAWELDEYDGIESVHETHRSWS